jgi:DNA-directed RNA polymerase specialized sigma24 family protein
MNQNITTNSKSAPELVFDRRLELVDEAIDLYHTYLQSYLYGLTAQWQDAENLMQDLWQHVLLHFDENKIKVLPILRRKAWQIFVDFYRARQRRGETLTDELPDMPISYQNQEAFTDAEEKALQSSFWERFPGVEISEEQKEILWLNGRYGFTYAEIEAKIGVPSSTICDWIATARKTLTNYLNTQS